MGLLKTVLGSLNRLPSGKHPGRIQLNLPDEQLAAVVEQTQAYPFMGGKKGAANLVHAELAWVDAGSYDTVNATMARLVGEELSSRRRGNAAPKPFEPPVATGLGQVWGSDLFELRVWDQRFHICDFLDIFNQEYLALEASTCATDSDFVAAGEQQRDLEGVVHRYDATCENPRAAVFVVPLKLEDLRRSVVILGQLDLGRQPNQLVVSRADPLGRLRHQLVLSGHGDRGSQASVKRGLPVERQAHSIFGESDTVTLTAVASWVSGPTPSGRGAEYTLSQPLERSCSSS